MTKDGIYEEKDFLEEARFHEVRNNNGPDYKLVRMLRQAAAAASRIGLRNQDRYKTAHERVEAHRRYCVHDNPECKGDGIRCVECFAYWLAHEAEEKTEPCPFCGAETYLIEDNNQYLVRCRNRCCYRGKSFLEKSEAIAEHNRVARGEGGAE